MHFNEIFDTTDCLIIENMYYPNSSYKFLHSRDLILKECTFKHVEAASRKSFVTSSYFKTLESLEIHAENCKMLGSLKASRITLKNCDEIKSVEFEEELCLTNVGKIEKVICPFGAIIENGNIETIIVKAAQNANMSHIILINSQVRHIITD